MRHAHAPEALDPAARGFEIHRLGRFRLERGFDRVDAAIRKIIEPLERFRLGVFLIVGEQTHAHLVRRDLRELGAHVEVGTHRHFATRRRVERLDFLGAAQLHPVGRVSGFDQRALLRRQRPMHLAVRLARTHQPSALARLYIDRMIDFQDRQPIGGPDGVGLRDLGGPFLLRAWRSRAQRRGEQGDHDGQGNAGHGAKDGPPSAHVNALCVSG